MARPVCWEDNTMPAEIQASLRSPKAYEVARQALEVMQAHQVWPTVRNFELWVHYVSEGGSPLAVEIDRLLAAGEAITESLGEALAAQFLPEARLNGDILDAGDVLPKELQPVTAAIQSAPKPRADYGQDPAPPPARRELGPPAPAQPVGEGGAVTLAIIDIDHFKHFNDAWGHQIGDQVLRYVASVIGRLGATPRVAARYGGEEFAIIFPAESGRTAMAVLEEIRLEVSSRALKRRSTNEDLGAITVSAGHPERLAGQT